MRQTSGHTQTSVRRTDMDPLRPTGKVDSGVDEYNKKFRLQFRRRRYVGRTLSGTGVRNSDHLHQNP